MTILAPLSEGSIPSHGKTGAVESFSLPLLLQYMALSLAPS